MISFLSEVSVIFLVISLVINLFLTIVVYKTDKKSATNKIFGFLGLAIIVWLLVMYFSLISYNILVNIWLIRISILLAVGINTLFLLLGNTIPQRKISISKNTRLLLLFSTISMLFVVLTPLTFKDVDLSSGIPEPIPGPGIVIFASYIVFLTIAAFVSIYKRQKLETFENKKRLYLLGIGMILMIISILLTIIIPVNVFRNVSLVPLFPLSSLFFTGFAAYAIFKHGMFSVKVIGAQLITIILVSILLSQLFVATTLTELIIDAIVFTLAVLFGILLVRSVENEVKQKEKLQELTDKLKALDKQKDEFINMAAHELRAPMTAIKGYVSMILEGDAGEITDVARGYLTDVSAVNDRLVRLVNNMLNVSRIEEGRLVYKTEVVRLQDIAKNVYTAFRFEAERKGLSFTLKCDKAVDDYVKVDADRLNEIIGNFVSNSVKYTETGGITLKITNPKSKVVRLGVKDTGPGITKAEQDKLFMKFYRVQSTAGKTIGTGLGLYISKLLIQKFGGKIGLISDTGKGSEFWFELPVVSKDLHIEEPAENENN